MIQRANETFKFIEEHLPARISMPFVAYMILKEIVPEGPETLYPELLLAASSTRLSVEA